METSQPIFHLTFPEAREVVVCGDIHGDFNQLIFKLCVQYEMQDTLLIVAGDCGFGFEKREYYENMVRKNTSRMSKANNWIVFVRGNHDNSAYFDGETFSHKRFMAVPDYTVIEANGHTILTIGGAISVDRECRKVEWEKTSRRMHLQREDSPLSKNYYWNSEAPVFCPQLLSDICREYKVDEVITHTAPSFCELTSKDGIERWAMYDNNLLADVTAEREVMDNIWKLLRQSDKIINHWCYGHFHQSRSSQIDGTLFKMLDIMELYSLH